MKRHPVFIRTFSLQSPLVTVWHEPDECVQFQYTQTVSVVSSCVIKAAAVWSSFGCLMTWPAKFTKTCSFASVSFLYTLIFSFKSKLLQLIFLLTISLSHWGFLVISNEANNRPYVDEGTSRDLRFFLMWESI